MLCFSKGGEIMYFRHFILMGVFLGAAAFFPTNTFATGNAGQPEPPSSAPQTLVSEKKESSGASEKVLPVTSENVNKSQDGTVQKPAANPDAQQTVPIHSVSKLPNATNRSFEKAMPSLEMKANESAEQVAKLKDTGQTEPSKPNIAIDKLQEGPKSRPQSSNQTDSQAETDNQPRGLNAKSETIREENDFSESIKTGSSLTLAAKPYIDEENNTPSNDRKSPLDIEVMNNPPQRTQSSGGQSDVQFTPEAGTISFIAKRFDMDEYITLALSQIYTSRQARYCHQWINAPPSPPPKATPFFLTFTANLSKCND